MKKKSIKHYKKKKNTNVKLIIFIILIFLILSIFCFQKYKNYLYLSTNTLNIEDIFKGIIKKEIKSEMLVIKEIEPATKIPVFTFHRIVPDNVKHEKYENDEWTASVDVFEQQIKYLYDNGYKTISLDQLYCWYKEECDFDKKTVVLTFDDGNYDDYYLVLPILKKYNYKATTFILGSRTLNIDEEYDPYVRRFITKKMINDVEKTYPNWTFESHTYNLHNKDENETERVLVSTREEIKEDFDKNSEFKFSYIAYPFGAYNNEIINEAKNHNYKLAFTFKANNRRCASRKDQPYEMPRIKINGFSDVEEIKKWLDC